jgi:hypothetical protein
MEKKKLSEPSSQSAKEFTRRRGKNLGKDPEGRQIVSVPKRTGESIPHYHTRLFEMGVGRRFADTGRVTHPSVARDINTGGTLCEFVILKDSERAEIEARMGGGEPSSVGLAGESTLDDLSRTRGEIRNLENSQEGDNKIPAPGSIPPPQGDEARRLSSQS